MLPEEKLNKTILVGLQDVDIMLAATIVVIRVEEGVRFPGTIGGARDHARELSLVEVRLRGSPMSKGRDVPAVPQTARVQ